MRSSMGGVGSGCWRRLLGNRDVFRGSGCSPGIQLDGIGSFGLLGVVPSGVRGCSDLDD